MKKIFLFAAAAMVSLSSCVQTEEVYTGKVNEMGFKSAVTRGIIQTQSDFTYPISVSSVWENPNDGLDKYVVRFDNAKFVYDESLTNWRGETPYYWPNAGNMNFLAFCPYPSNATITTNYNATTGKIDNMVITNISNNLKEQHDVLFSDLLSVLAPQTSAQALQFHHASAQLNVEFKKTNSAAEVVLNSVEFWVCVGGDLTITAGDPTSTAEWTAHDGHKLQGLFKSTSVSSFTDVALDAILAHDSVYSPVSLLVVPTNQTYVKITYTVNGHQDVKTIDLTSYGKWEMGKKYTYKFAVNVNEIIFDCDVDAWEEVDINGGAQITI
jgi:hypothetical protein